MIVVNHNNIVKNRSSDLQGMEATIII